MKHIKVLGSGCKKCAKTAEAITRLANELNISVHVIKETNPEAIMSYSVMSTPAVVIDDVLIHSGSIPHTEDIKHWLLDSNQ